MKIYQWIANGASISFSTATMNIGYTYASRAAARAIIDSINPVSTSMIAYVIVFASCEFTPNIDYALQMLNKNHTFNDFSCPDSSFAQFKALLIGSIWLGMLSLYTKLTAFLGEFGPVIGWIMFLSRALIISNTLAFENQRMARI